MIIIIMMMMVMVIIILSTIHGFPDGHAASDLGVESQSSNSDQGGDFFVTGNGGGNGKATGMKLGLDASTTIAFDVRSTTNAGKAFGTFIFETK